MEPERLTSSGALAPSAGMVGAGQLARMTHSAAVELGVELRVLAAHPGDPAVLAGAASVIGSPDDPAAMLALAADCDVVTFDHELVSPDAIAVLEASGVAVHPSRAALAYAQDKLHARRELGALGFPVPRFAHATIAEDVERFGEQIGWPIIGKAITGGYDGRGVFELASADEGAEALASLPGGMLLEERLALERELAIIVARSPSGAMALYPLVQTVQRDAMCREVLYPVAGGEHLAQSARELASGISEAIGAVGVMALELFETADGLLVNELALRPHNSGHYTIEACETSQFEQHLRAVLDLPLGSTALREEAVASINVVGVEGDPRAHLAAALAVDGAHVHLYGKQPRPGRKLGHVTVCGEVPADVQASARRAAALLEGRADD